MYYFCTYFDHRYLPKGLALYHSLKQHCPAFRLWVLCLNSECHQILTRLNLPEIQLIRLEEFEQGDIALQEAKKNRTLVEYYFTCTPSLPLFIFQHVPEVDLITYLDADLFFFSDLNPIYQEIGQHSIAIISHRFSPKYLHMQIFGIYNVGWLSFRRNIHGLTCLRWWREQCLEWCHDRPENGRFADQKYLDDWPTRFQSVVVLQHKGINVARWNLDHYTIYEKNNQFWIDEQRLIFFHFHGVTEVEEGSYAANVDAEQFVGTVREIFIYYFQVVNDIKQQLLPLFPEISVKESVRGQQIIAQTEEKSMETTQNLVQEVINVIERAVNRVRPQASSYSKKENTPLVQPSPQVVLNQKEENLSYQTPFGPQASPSLKQENTSRVLPSPQIALNQKEANLSAQTPSPTRKSSPSVALAIMQPSIMQLIRGQQIKQAIQTLEEQIKHQPYLAMAYNDLGTLLFHQAETRQEGLNHLERATWLAPTEPTIQKNLAYVYMLMNRPEEALQMFNRFLNQFPNDIESLVQSAELCTHLGREARPFWERVLQLDANHVEARRALG